MGPATKRGHRPAGLGGGSSLLASFAPGWKWATLLKESSVRASPLQRERQGRHRQEGDGVHGVGEVLRLTRLTLGEDVGERRWNALLRKV
jgi:hypothetical protein